MENQIDTITESLFAGAASAVLSHFAFVFARRFDIGRPEYPTENEIEFMNNLQKYLPPVICGLITVTNYLYRVVGATN